MSSKKTLIITILSTLTIIILIITIILFMVNKNERDMQENIRMIKSNYANISHNMTDNDEIKKDLLNQLSAFNNETYQEEHSKYKTTLKKYDRNVEYVEALIKDMEKRCKHNYDDITAKLLCQGYDTIYEETINSYIKVVNDYNSKLTKYNETAETPYKLHTPIYSDYIDYNKDGKFEGK